MSRIAVACPFYAERYETVALFHIARRDRPRFLGDRSQRVCRFCGRDKTSTTFSTRAHAIPESLGNTTLFSAYECDACNQLFGDNIENDLANWSKPHRTIARIRGKRGVPTMKSSGQDSSWRIEYEDTGFRMTHYEHDPFFTIDEKSGTIEFHPIRDPYIPVAVLKALVKVGLTLIPDGELHAFADTMPWVMSTNHTASFMRSSTVVATFVPGPMPSDLMYAEILRRRGHISDVPYAFLILSYGNETYQVSLPSRAEDAVIAGKQLSFPPYPPQHSPAAAGWERATHKPVDMSGQSVVRGEKIRVSMHFDAVRETA